MKRPSTLPRREIELQFEEQISAHELLIKKVCRMYAYTAIDREDLFQDIIVQVWQAYPRFRGEAKFSTWLYRVAINTAITRTRKQKNLITYVEPEALPTNRGEESSGHAEAENMQLLHDAIAQLNDVERAIVMLYMDERSYEEMEEVLGIASGTLRVKINRIKDKLRGLTKKSDYGT